MEVRAVLLDTVNIDELGEVRERSMALIEGFGKHVCICSYMSEPRPSSMKNLEPI